MYFFLSPFCIKFVGGGSCPLSHYSLVLIMLTSFMELIISNMLYAAIFMLSSFFRARVYLFLGVILLISVEPETDEMVRL